MKIGLIADSHDNVHTVENMLEVFKKMGIEVAIHAGDYVAPFTVKRLLDQPWDFYGVFGNNDGEVEGISRMAPQIKKGPIIVDLGSIRIGVVHDRADWDGSEYDVLVFGHTHKCFYKEYEGKLEINPGELGGWMYGKSTIAVLDSETFDAEIIEV